MKQIPPVVYVIGAVASVVVIGLYLARRQLAAVGGAVVDAYSPGGVAYSAGDSIQDAIIPGSATVGTFAYDATHNEDGTFNWLSLVPGYIPYRIAQEGASAVRGLMPTTSAQQMAAYSYPGGATYPAREGSNPFLPDYVQGYGYSTERPPPYRYDFTGK